MMSDMYRRLTCLILSALVEKTLGFSLLAWVPAMLLGIIIPAIELTLIILWDLILDMCGYMQLVTITHISSYEPSWLSGVCMNTSSL